MQSDLIIKLLNGSERSGSLNQEFDPSTDRIDFFCTTNQYEDSVEDLIDELLVNSTKIKQAIKQSIGVDKIAEVAMGEGMRSLRMDGIQKIFLGLLDLNQVNRVST